jgi:hypothetical protein
MNYYEKLKELQVKLSPGYKHNLVLRTHRALSWLQRAEQEAEDSDARFVFMWIAFNALYGRDIPNRKDNPERKVYRLFLQRLVKSDKSRLLQKIVSGEFSGQIASLIDNQYIFQPFWDFNAGRITEERWQKAFTTEVDVGCKALANANSYKVLEITLDRLYVIRNQVVHGNSTWKGHTNRLQLDAGAEILSYLVPAFLFIILHSPDKDWGAPSYKVVD